jgi:hypothetical protein
MCVFSQFGFQGVMCCICGNGDDGGTQLAIMNIIRAMVKYRAMWLASIRASCVVIRRRRWSCKQCNFDS